MNRRGLATALALVPGLVSVAAGAAGATTLAVALAAALGVAFVVARARAGVPLPEGRAGLADTFAWLAGSAALVGTTLLASPFPFGLGTDTRGRHLVLVLGALVAAASVAFVSERPSPRPAVPPSA